MFIGQDEEKCIVEILSPMTERSNAKDEHLAVPH